ncbi:hypothetical protein [Bradyrhizobium neotropicale]|nr:hypothetical protein [Bradyrhizobium neotropicale]
MMQALAEAKTQYHSFRVELTRRKPLPSNISQSHKPSGIAKGWASNCCDTGVQQQRAGDVIGFELAALARCYNPLRSKEK